MLFFSITGDDTAQVLISALNSIGTFVFAISGALAAIRRQADIFGIIVLAFATSSFGGICRDVLTGQFPPSAVQSSTALFLSLGAALLTYVAYPVVKRMNNPIEFFDALGLGVFAVLGANKALSVGITPVWAVILGIITAVGGGIVRDMLLAEVPRVLRKEIYATAALVGATILVVGKLYVPEYEQTLLLAGAICCSAIRLISIKQHWNLPARQDS